MDGDKIPPRSERKYKFRPNPLKAVRVPERTAPKTEARDENAEDDATTNRNLIREFNRRQVRKGSNVEKQSSVQVAFGGPGSSSSIAIKASGERRAGSSSKASDSGLQDHISDNMEIDIVSPSTAGGDGIDECSSDESAEDEAVFVGKDKPIKLPWRRPNSGARETLDKEEFAGAAEEEKYDETTINDAAKLGLQEESQEPKMFLFQFPPEMPISKHSAKGKEKAGSSKDASVKEMSTLKELPGGYVGKMRVYKSGKIELKLAGGEYLYYVDGGHNPSCPEHVAAIDTKNRTYTVVEEMEIKRAIARLDVLGMLTKKGDKRDSGK